MCLLYILIAFHHAFAQAVIILVCESLVVCPGDDQQRRCFCFSTLNLTWTTNRTGVFDGSGITFGPANPVDSSATAMGFVVNLTSNINGLLISIMTFTPTAVSSSGLAVTCANYLNEKFTVHLAVTLPGTFS